MGFTAVATDACSACVLPSTCLDIVVGPGRTSFPSNLPYLGAALTQCLTKSIRPFSVMKSCGRISLQQKSTYFSVVAYLVFEGRSNLSWWECLLWSVNFRNNNCKIIEKLLKTIFKRPAKPAKIFGNSCVPTIQHLWKFSVWRILSFSGFCLNFVKHQRSHIVPWHIMYSLELNKRIIHLKLLKI